MNKKELLPVASSCEQQNDLRSVSLDQGQPTIVCGADDKFSMPLAVTLFSSLVNLREGVRPHIYVLDGGITASNKNRISAVLQKANKPFELTWKGYDLSLFHDLRETEAISKAAYLRILIPDLLPASLSKAIYLDSDMIVEVDLMNLWELEFDAEAAMGVQDYCFPFISDTTVINDFHSYGYSKQTLYCNSGLIVFNLPFWRTHGIKSKVLQYLRKNKEALDQDGINMAIGGNWKQLDPKWNVTLSSLSLFGDGLPMSRQVRETCIQELRSTPYIIHYTSCYKPWQTGWKNKAALTVLYYDKDFRNRYFHYLLRSGWFSKPKSFFWVGYRKAVLFFQFQFPRRLKLLFNEKAKAKSTNEFI